MIIIKYNPHKIHKSDKTMNNSKPFQETNNNRMNKISKKLIEVSSNN